MSNPLDTQVAKITQRIANAQQEFARAEAHFRVAQENAIAKYGTADVAELTQLLEAARTQHAETRQKLQDCLQQAEDILRSVEAHLPSRQPPKP